MDQSTAPETPRELYYQAIDTKDGTWRWRVFYFNEERLAVQHTKSSRHFRSYQDAIDDVIEWLDNNNLDGLYVPDNQQRIL